MSQVDMWQEESAGPILMTQRISIDGQVVVFVDRRQAICSAPCQPRDIQIIEGPDTDKVREAIAIDIRLGQGMPAVGVAKNLLFA